MVLKFIKNKSSYVLMTDMAPAAFVLEIKDVSLIVRKIEVSSDVIMENAGKIIPYPITRVAVGKNRSTLYGECTWGMLR